MERGEFHGNQYEVSADLPIPKVSQADAAGDTAYNLRNIDSANWQSREGKVTPSWRTSVLGKWVVGMKGR